MKTLTRSATLLITMIAVLFTSIFIDVPTVHASDSYQTKLDSVYAANPYFDKNVFAAGTAYAPVIEAAYDSGASLRDFLFNVYVNNSTYYPTPESFFYSTKPTITLNAATGVVMYQDDYANCMRYHNGEMAAEVAFYQTMLDSGIFTEVLREMGSNSYYSGIGLDWTQAINKRTAYMTALGYEVKDIYVLEPSRTVKGVEWYVYTTTDYLKNQKKQLKNHHANVMHTMLNPTASSLTRGMEYLENMYVLTTAVQPFVRNDSIKPSTSLPDWTFQYPYVHIDYNFIDGVVSSPYTMDYIYN